MFVQNTKKKNSGNLQGEKKKCVAGFNWFFPDTTAKYESSRLFYFDQNLYVLKS